MIDCDYEELALCCINLKCHLEIVFRPEVFGVIDKRFAFSCGPVLNCIVDGSPVTCEASACESVSRTRSHN